MTLNKAGKLYAVASALLLAGGFVAYRQMGQIKATQKSADEPIPYVSPAADSLTVLPSSKSMVMPTFTPRSLVPNESIPPEVNPFQPETAPDLPASKTAAIITPENVGTISPADMDALFDEPESEVPENAPPE